MGGRAKSDFYQFSIRDQLKARVKDSLEKHGGFDPADPAASP